MFWREIGSLFVVIGMFYAIDGIVPSIKNTKLENEILEIEKEKREREREIVEKRYKYLEDFWDGCDD